MADSREIAKHYMQLWDSGVNYFEVKTSGSTGNPKKIQLSRNAIIASAQSSAAAIQLQADDSIHCCLPTDKISGMMQLFRSKIWNIPITITEPEINPLLSGSFGSIISLTPQQLHTAVNEKQSLENLNRYRIVLIGGAAIPSNLEKKIQPLHPIFYHTYGMTETCSHIALRRCNFQREFHAIPGIELQLTSEGCLKIKGAVTNHTWIETRDTAQFSNGGFLITGRVDNIINSGGIKIQPEELEQFLHTTLNTAENEIAVTSVPDEILGEGLVYILDKSASEKYASSEIPFPNKYWKPKFVYCVESIPLTPTQKPDRKALRELAAALHENPEN